MNTEEWINVPDDPRTITAGACPTPVACNTRMGCNGACTRLFLLEAWDDADRGRESLESR